jgi:hypothetical protein
VWPARANARTSLAAAAALIVVLVSRATTALAGDATTAGRFPGGDDPVGTVVELRGPDGARYELGVAAKGETYVWPARGSRSSRTS